MVLDQRLDQHLSRGFQLFVFADCTSVVVPMVPQVRQAHFDTTQDQTPDQLDHLFDMDVVHNRIDFSRLTVRIV